MFEKHFYEYLKYHHDQAEWRWKKEKGENGAELTFFSQRIISEWNKLPEEVVAAESVNMFKNRLDKLRKR